MGMFDYVCDQNGVEWQTKSFSRPALDRYRLTDKRRLEKGRALDLIRKYSANDLGELIADIERFSANGPRFTWTKHHFTGPIQALMIGADGELLEAKFEFQDGILV